MRKYPIPWQFFTAVWLSILLLQGCKGERSDASPNVYKVPLSDSCLFEPDHHYDVTYPDRPDPKQLIPLVIVIDPHGDGLTAMQKFRDALEDLPFVIAGSEKIRNNYENFEISLQNLYQDILEKYPVDPQRVFVAGFSGGARMALYYGLHNPANGIIMFGAGPGNLPSGYQSPRIYAVSGTRDFNFIEQYRPLFSGIRDHTAYVNDYFRGIHSWPPGRYIREAVVFSLRDETESFKEISNNLSLEFLQEYDSLRNAEDLFFAGKALEKAWYFSTESKQQKALLEKINAFASDEEWMACQREIETYFNQEVTIKAMYVEKLADPDLEWWTGELNSLFAKINNGSNPVETDYYYRLKGFLGIYLYSRITQLLRTNNSSGLMDRLMEIYEQVEPQSEDLVRFKVELSRLRGLKSNP
jgi:pimeloyl-ACP methyl ester carboxylesterase